MTLKKSQRNLSQIDKRGSQNAPAFHSLPQYQESTELEKCVQDHAVADCAGRQTGGTTTGAKEDAGRRYSVCLMHTGLPLVLWVRGV